MGRKSVIEVGVNGKGEPVFVDMGDGVGYNPSYNQQTGKAYEDCDFDEDQAAEDAAIDADIERQFIRRP